MRDETDSAVLTDVVEQGFEHLLERAAVTVGIEAAKAFVDEDGVEADVAARAFDDVGEPEGERQRRNEGLV